MVKKPHVFLKSRKNPSVFSSSQAPLISVPHTFPQVDPQYILAHVKEYKCQVGCFTREGRPEAKDSSKVGRGNDLTGKGLSPIVSEQGQQSKTSDHVNYPKGSSKYCQASL